MKISRITAVPGKFSLNDHQPTQAWNRRGEMVNFAGCQLKVHCHPVGLFFSFFSKPYQGVILTNLEVTDKNTSCF